MIYAEKMGGSLLLLPEKVNNSELEIKEERKAEIAQQLCV